MSDKKVLIAYYSYSGNTRTVAQKIQKYTDGDIFEIVPKFDYPKNYNEVVSQAKKEKNENILPELKEYVKNISEYDVIFIGTPVWWYTAAPVVKTFLVNNDFYGKIIVPFCTHGGGGASATYSDIQNIVPNAKVLMNGLTTYENTADDKTVSQWVRDLKI